MEGKWRESGREVKGKWRESGGTVEGKWIVLLASRNPQAIMRNERKKKERKKERKKETMTDDRESI